MINVALAMELRARGWGLFGKTYIAYPAIPPQMWISGTLAPVPGFGGTIVIGMSNEYALPDVFQFFFEQSGKYRGTTPQAGIVTASLLGELACWYYTSAASPLWVSLFNRSAVWQNIGFWIHTLDFIQEDDMLKVKEMLESGEFQIPGRLAL